MSIYADIACATGWNMDYIRHNMTFKRYQALKKNWKESPPVATCLAAILKMLGMEPKGNSQDTDGEALTENGNYYDEDYYHIAEQPAAFGALGAAFQRANGGD